MSACDDLNIVYTNHGDFLVWFDQFIPPTKCY